MPTSMTKKVISESLPSQKLIEIKYEHIADAHLIFESGFRLTIMARIRETAHGGTEPYLEYDYFSPK